MEGECGKGGIWVKDEGIAAYEGGQTAGPRVGRFFVSGVVFGGLGLDTKPCLGGGGALCVLGVVPVVCGRLALCVEHAWGRLGSQSKEHPLPVCLQRGRGFIRDEKNEMQRFCLVAHRPTLHLGPPTTPAPRPSIKHNPGL